MRTGPIKSSSCDCWEVYLLKKHFPSNFSAQNPFVSIPYFPCFPLLPQFRLCFNEIRAFVSHM